MERGPGDDVTIFKAVRSGFPPRPTAYDGLALHGAREMGRRCGTSRYKRAKPLQHGEDPPVSSRESAYCKSFSILVST